MRSIVFVSLFAAIAGIFAITNGHGESASARASAISGVAVPQAEPLDTIDDLFFYNGPRTSFAATGVVGLMQGNGNFVQSFTKTDMSPDWQVYTGNFNNDQWTDVFLYDGKNTALVMLSNQVGKLFPSNTRTDFPAGVTVVPGNYNNDSLTDLFLYNYTTGAFLTLFSDGLGDWTTAKSGTYSTKWLITPGRFNNDSLTDLYLYNGDYATFPATSTTLIANGDGSFTQKPNSIEKNDWSVYAGDFNGDGFTDLWFYEGFAQANPAASVITFSNGDGGWVVGPPTNDFYPFWSVIPGDYNGDTRTDLFLYNGPGIGKGEILFADGGGTWVQGPIIDVPSVDSFTAGHFNADNLTDLFIYTGDGTSSVANGRVIFADGAGNWINGPLLDLSGDWKQIVTGRFGVPFIWGDVDCSGKLDPVDGLRLLKVDAGQPPTQTVAGCPPYNTVKPVNGLNVLWGDVDCSGALDPVDALKILAADAGKPIAQTVPDCPDLGALF